jgi:hypothetical protein
MSFRSCLTSRPCTGSAEIPLTIAVAHAAPTVQPISVLIICSSYRSCECEPTTRTSNAAARPELAE